MTIQFNTSIANEFSAFEYLLITLATNYNAEEGMMLDKENFEVKIDWALNNFRDFELMIGKAKEPAVFARAVHEFNCIRQYMKSNPTGLYRSRYIAGLDSTCSVLQVMGVSMNCLQTSLLTNVIDPTKRNDFYNYLMLSLDKIVDESKKNAMGTLFCRKHVKKAVMVYAYGGMSKVYKVFGKAKAIDEFIAVMNSLAPGAMYLREMLLGAIKSNRIEYNWSLPDGFQVRSKVTTTKLVSVEIDELRTAKGNKATFSHQFRCIGWDEYYLATGANGIHSVDSYIAREAARRVSYDKEVLLRAKEALAKIAHKEITDRTEIISIRLASKFAVNDYSQRAVFTPNQLGLLSEKIDMCLLFEPAPLITVHDEFKTYPSNLGQVRFHYKELLAEIAESNLMQSIVRQMYQDDSLVLNKMDSSVVDHIRNSRYAIC